MENKTKIVKAILAVMQEVKNIDKAMTVGEGRNAYQGVADKDVKNIVGGAMAKHGLVALPISVEPTTKVERWEQDETWNGQSTRKVKQSVFTEVKTRYLLMHESGESIEIEGIGHGVDPQDKAAGKATTYALKNALLYSFLVPTGHIDDTDATHSDNIATPQAALPQPSNGKEELKPNTQAWKEAAKWLAGQDGEVSEHLVKIKKKYTISAANEKKLSGDASLIRPKGEHNSDDVPEETLLAIKEATDMESLTRIYNECTDLHTSKAFVNAYAARRRELAKLGKAA